MKFEDLTQEDRERWERYVVTGLHAFLFVDHVMGDGTLREAVDALQALIPGDEPGFARLSAAERPCRRPLGERDGGAVQGVRPSLGAAPSARRVARLHRRESLWELGLRCDYAVQGTAYTGPTGKIYPLKIKRCDVVGFVRIWLSGGSEGGTLDILARLSELDGFQGAATVFGSFDVLLVLDGEEIDDVAKVIMGTLRGTPGIARTETAFADYRRYDGVMS